MNHDDIILKPGDLAREVHILPSKISYYTSLGLLRVAEYTEGGQKLYPRRESIIQLKRIEKFINRGLRLEEIHSLIGISTKGRKILVIDDEPTVGEVLKDLFSGKSHVEVQVVMDGFAAGLKLQEYFPDLIILDLMLPGVDGFAVCKKIRGNELHYGVKILAITGYDSEENYRRIIECGADDYLPKPFQADEIIVKIYKLLGIKKSSLTETHEGEE